MASTTKNTGVTVFSVELTKYKECKGSWHFRESGTTANQPICGSLYVKKDSLAKIGDPDKLTIEIRPKS